MACSTFREFVHDKYAKTFLLEKLKFHPKGTACFRISASHLNTIIFNLRVDEAILQWIFDPDVLSIGINKIIKCLPVRNILNLKYDAISREEFMKKFPTGNNDDEEVLCIISEIPYCNKMLNSLHDFLIKQYDTTQMSNEKTSTKIEIFKVDAWLHERNTSTHSVIDVHFLLQPSSITKAVAVEDITIGVFYEQVFGKKLQNNITLLDENKKKLEKIQTIQELFCNASFNMPLTIIVDDTDPMELDEFDKVLDIHW